MQPADLVQMSQHFHVMGPQTQRIFVDPDGELQLPVVAMLEATRKKLSKRSASAR